MARWFTADLHFGHENIITYCSRPFASVDEMNRALIARWNEVVEPTDEVWILGDVALGPIGRSLELIAELNGTKRLVAGNHDRCFEEVRRAGQDGTGQGGRWTLRYREAGFVSVLAGPTNIEIAGRTAQMSHFPYWGDSHAEDRFEAHRPVDTGDWLLHGHVHTQWRTNERMINVGVDVWDYAPVPERTIQAIVDSELQSQDTRRRLPI
ncbi:MAG: metallophosphoesterase [Actinobacteria bacterium]|nr:metallophosphoesterase [Actinomycetota bacterium]